MTKAPLLAGFAAATLALAGCAKKAPEQLPPAPTETGTSDTGAGGQPAAAGPGTQEHFTTAVGADNATVYFDTDKFDIDAEDAAKLQAQARYFTQYTDVTFTVEGHADERGTREYNLALGERRANAAKNYLVGLGIPEARIRTVSYGKERPVALDSSEAAWAQNRRAASVVIG
ncbi:peptidoglycan-associated lipoprotein Pal [Qipengyuania sediminis]|uniref:peptidoglycan-associated lipoprotein Pal n=1 Tax=Qipengyuania sediminis TaxID=1532023 RepID=UPI00105949AD|nr:peptidoglycan-associated lipoprotein Pal [Qipengyuania sediminis]